MLNQLNKACARLWRDESGVVLAITVIVYLTLFMMACAVYATGENIRQRIELQNAADAAAYSAAVVQADAISRIAAINRAMGWTYIQLGKQQMDVTVDEWLRLVRDQWQPDYDKAEKHNHAGCGHFNDHYSGSTSDRKHVNLNGRFVHINEINAAINAFAGRRNEVKGQIRDAHLAIQGMNEAEDNIVNLLQGRIEEVVRKIMQKNMQSTPTGDARFAVLHEASACFTGQDEQNFFRSLFGAATDPNSIFGSGAGDWYNLTSEDGGFYRKYEQGARLVATWEWYGNRWRMRRHSCGLNCHYWSCDNVHNIVKGSQIIRGADARPGNEVYFDMQEPARPRILSREYFEEEGAIVVAAARRMQNPFLSTFGDLGLFSVFNPRPSAGGNPYMWGVAAARAGYLDVGRDSQEGSYNPTCDSHFISRDEGKTDNQAANEWYGSANFPGWSMNAANLTFSDWDGVLLPVRSAWSGRKPAWANRSRAAGHAPSWGYTVGEWLDPDAGDRLLTHLMTSAEWRELEGNDVMNGLSDGLSELDMAEDLYH